MPSVRNCFGIMTGSVNVLNFTRNFYQKIGIYPTQSNHSAFNLKNVFFILVMVQLGIAIGLYFIFKAKKLDEMSMTFYSSITVLISTYYFVSNIWQNKNILILVKKYNEFIEQSKLLLIY